MQGFANNNMMNNMPFHCCPLTNQMQSMNNPQKTLEAMYPKSYFILEPVVEMVCDRVISTYGLMYNPDSKQVESMIDDVYSNTENSILDTFENDKKEGDRQFAYSGRRILRDLIGIMLLSSLLRRRNPYIGYPNYPGIGGYIGYSPYSFPYTY